MAIGEAMFSQRSIRRFRPDPIPMDDVRLIIEAAVKAPSGGNRQPGRFLVLTDRDLIRQFGALYREAWWAKRRDEGRPWTTRDEIPEEERSPRSAALLADEIKDAPCIVLAFSTTRGAASSVIPPVQNLMLAARALPAPGRAGGFRVRFACADLRSQTRVISSDRIVPVSNFGGIGQFTFGRRFPVP